MTKQSLKHPQWPDCRRWHSSKVNYPHITEKQHCDKTPEHWMSTAVRHLLKLEQRTTVVSKRKGKWGFGKKKVYAALWKRQSQQMTFKWSSCHLWCLSKCVDLDIPKPLLKPIHYLHLPIHTCNFDLAPSDWLINTSLSYLMNWINWAGGGMVGVTLRRVWERNNVHLAVQRDISDSLDIWRNPCSFLFCCC